MQTFLGEGTKIDVVQSGQDVLQYHIEGQGLTTIDDTYRGSVPELLDMLLSPIGLRVDGNRIVTNFQQGK